MDGSENNKKSFIFEGNRIVELDTLAADLWCKKCDIPLSLRDAISETNHCLASSFEIICQTCKNKHRVNTCKKSPNGRSRFPINGEIISGMQNIGIELSTLNRILTSMDIPAIEPLKLKKYEEELAEVNDIDTTESTKKAIKMKEFIYTDAIDSAEEAIEIEESTTITVERTQKWLI